MGVGVTGPLADKGKSVEITQDGSTLDRHGQQLYSLTRGIEGFAATFRLVVNNQETREREFLNKFIPRDLSGPFLNFFEGRETFRIGLRVVPRLLAHALQNITPR